MSGAVPGLVPWWQTAGSAPDWTAAEQGVRSLCSLLPPKDFGGLVDVRVAGRNVIVDVTYGTSSTLTVQDLRPPFRAALPGTINVNARKRDPAVSAWARIALQPVSGGLSSMVRSVGTGPGDAPLTARAATALDAAVLVVAGVVVNLVPGERIEVTQETTLTSGTVIWEHEL